MPSVPTQSLSSGDAPSIVGFGTWNLSDDEIRDVLPIALDHGYTHIDTAEGYQNEQAIGEVLADYNREDLFLTSKVLPSNLHYEEVLKALSRSLNALGTDYLDLYLIHWPNPTISLRETFQALQRVYEEGLIRNVGVSNFGIYQLRFAQKIANVPITANQIEFHPWYFRQELMDYCQQHDIVVEAAAPLARGAFLDDPLVTDIANKHDVVPAQVILKWAIGKEVIVLPKSSNPDHIRANLELFDWELDAEDLTRLDEIDQMENIYWLDLDDDIYGIPA